MCGIFFACSNSEHVVPDDATESALRARGPDSLKVHHTSVRPRSLNGTTPSSSKNGESHLTFASSVLSLRGDVVCIQPLIDPLTGSVLCWNGEAWKIQDVEVQGNDTEQVFRLLLEASAVADHSVSQKLVLETLTSIAGPFAFVFYDATRSMLYYGRDRLGRRSLLMNSPNTSKNKFMISSFSFDDNQIIEVATNGIHFIDFATYTPSPQLLPWKTTAPSINKAFSNDNDTLSHIPSQSAVTSLKKFLSESIRLRVLGVPTYTIASAVPTTSPSRVAILFSGGLDCSLLARLTDDILPLDQPVDLLNVAFENPRTMRAAAQSMKNSTSANSVLSPYEMCPDRVTARASFAELTSICPTRTWRFVAINIPYSETLAHRSMVIKLMSPHNTEMDLSITLALYFASRGQGEVITTPDSEPTPYTTTSRVLLSGLGADELFGGYARHPAAFNRSGYEGLNDELELDFTRIGTRNLGRDDRVMAHWGREIRYPYLDEDFVKFALGLPAWEKVGFRSGKAIPKHFEGSGERILVDKPEDLDPAKMLLRLAVWSLGMKGVAGEKKRAIQFGARTAKMEGGRTKGTDLLV